MTDIVKRLRALDAWALDDATAVMHAGADEIERLRGTLRRIGLPGKQIVYCRDGHEEAVLHARAALGEGRA